MIVKPTEYRQDEGVPFEELPAAERAAVNARIKALGMILKENKKARYKLEVMFDAERSEHKPFGGIVTFYESGNKLHGGGDTKVYMCPGRHLGRSECESPIPENTSGSSFLMCPTCKKLWKSNEVFGEVWYRLPMQKWADVMHRWFLKLEMDADIRIKYARDDIRHIARLEQERKRGGELYAKARDEDRRTTAIYELANMIKDAESGGDVRTRILAFLRS